MFKRIFKIVGEKNKKKFFMAVFLIFFSSVLDLVGVTSVLPFLSLIADPNIINENVFLNNIKYFFNLSDKNFIILFGFISLILIIINQLFRMLSNWYSVNFSENLSFENSRNMFFYYLNRPYNFFLLQNNAILLQKCTNYVASSVSGYILPFLGIIGSLLTTGLILTFLIIYQPYVTAILIIIVGIFYFVFFNKIKNRIANISKILPEYYSESSKIISDAFGSIKESKLKKNSSYFVEKFTIPAIKKRDSQISLEIYNFLPTAIIEIFVYTILFGLFLFLYFHNSNFSTAIPTMGVIVISLRRIVPAIQHIYSNIIQLKYHKETSLQIQKDLEKSYRYANNEKNNNKKNQKISFDKQIQFKNLKFKYNKTRNEKNILSVNLRINKGEFVGICGKSGHGKTTFVDILTGLLFPSKGKILIDGKELQLIHLNDWHSKISYAPQNGFILDDTILGNITFGDRKKINFKKIKKICNLVQLSKFIENNLYKGYHSKLGSKGVRLSGGQTQRLIIARALYKNPEMLILDEPISSLDNITGEKIFKNIQQKYKNLTIIFITHKTEYLKNCDNIFFFEEGKILQKGKYNFLIKKNKKFKNLGLIENKKLSENLNLQG